jgi:8-oxo-dGTP diphosphatase
MGDDRKKYLISYISMIDVTCAIIISNNKILCVQRSAIMSMPSKWEFPGGKLEEGESEEECLLREIREELGLVVQITSRLRENIHEYHENLRIRLIPFICKITSGELSLKEHSQSKWLEKPDLLVLDWAEADLPVVIEYMKKS